MPTKNDPYKYKEYKVPGKLEKRMRITWQTAPNTEGNQFNTTDEDVFRRKYERLYSQYIEGKIVSLQISETV